jgi:hypothetical protein
MLLQHANSDLTRRIGFENVHDAQSAFVDVVKVNLTNSSFAILLLSN